MSVMNRGIVGQGYTIPVCSIVEQIWYDGHPEETFDTTEVPSWKDALLKMDDMIEYAAEEIFYFDYPYYGTETEKKHLECHILESYYTRDICCDSMIRWVMFLKERLQDIMPKYKAFYDAQIMLIASDILDPYHLKETKDVVSNKLSTRNNESTTESKSDSDNKTQANSQGNTQGNDNTKDKTVNKFSNTPQALASAVTAGDDIPLNYLSSMTVNETESDNNYNTQNSSFDQSMSKTERKDSNEFSSTDNSNESKMDKIIRDIRGNLSKMNNAQLIKDYDDVIMNIEKMITDELKDLFYQIY